MRYRGRFWARLTPTLALAGALAAGCGGTQPRTTVFAPPPSAAPTGDLNDSRFAATATTLPNGLVLIVGGVASEGPASGSTELYDPATGAFSHAGSLASGRAYHTATLLRDGRVLIAGGIGADGRPVAAAELYDPATRHFSVTGSLGQPRFDHTATLLQNGKVLIAGGDTTTAHTSNLATAELYDPATGSFGATGNVTRFYDPEADKFYYVGRMVAAHGKHTATLLQNGDVLIAGGGDAGGAVEAAAEVYDPANGKFAATGALVVARQAHRATRLANGMVLITGGIDANSHVLAQAELYDPARGKFTLTTAAFAGGTNLIEPRYEHTATLLPSGAVLIAGGGGGKTILNTAELYDPARGAFRCVGGAGVGGGCAGSMTEYRDYAAAARMANGAVLVVGGYNFRLGAARNPIAAQGMTGGAAVPFSILWSAEVYDPAAGTFVSTSAIAHAHFGGAG